jgi:tRNA(adenine34) deaminase
VFLNSLGVLKSQLHYLNMSRHRTKDELMMREALLQARAAEMLGEVPIGAVVVLHGKVLGRGHNRNLLDNDPSAHAEVMAMREAGRALGNHRLGECELFVTIEPCAMCAGAMVHARISRLVYGTSDPKAGAVQSVMKVLNHPQLNHRIEVESGVLSAECASLVQEFFRRKREKA